MILISWGAITIDRHTVELDESTLNPETADALAALAAGDTAPIREWINANQSDETFVETIFEITTGIEARE